MDKAVWARDLVEIAASRSFFRALAVLTTACILHFSYRLYRHRRWFHGLPQPPHDLLWGHLKIIGEVAATFPPNTHPQHFYTAIAQKYNLKGIFYIDLWPIGPSSVVLNDPSVSEQVTVAHPLRQHKMVDEFLAPILGHDVIAAANGATWKKLHNAMSPAFSWSHIRNLTGVIAEEGMHFRDTLNELARVEGVFSMEETAMKLIFDVITRIVFNFSLNAQTKGSSTLDDLREMVHLAENQLSFNPFVHLVTFFKRRSVLGRLHPSILQKIRERLALLRSGNIVPSRRDPESILDLMLRDHVKDDVNMKGAGISDLPPEYTEILLTNIKGLLVGGHGTTTDTLCYIYMLLAKTPEVVRKLREEHTRVFDKDFKETMDLVLQSPAKLEELEYTAAVIKETLRLFPVGFGVREAEAGMKVNFNGQSYPIDNGLCVALNAHAVQYDPENFADPAEFKPERWIEEEIPRSHFRTFGRGSRACLGLNLAQNELKIILLMTIRDYDFECANLKPNEKPRTCYTKLDTVYGDIVFQELGDRKSVV